MSGGIFGAMKRARLPSVRVSVNVIVIMTALVGVAAVTLIVKKSGLVNISWSNFDLVILSLSLGLAAIVGEWFFMRQWFRAWRLREPGAVMLGAGLWALCFLFSGNNWISVTSEGQSAKTQLQKTAFKTSQRAEADREAAFKRVLQAEAAEKRLRDARWQPLPKIDGQEVGSGAEAKAILDGMKANTRFMTLTENCTKSAGKETRAFVAKCSEAMAAIRADDTRVALEQTHQDAIAKVTAAKAEFDAADAATKTGGPAVESGERGDFLLYTRWLGMKDEDVALGQAAVMILFVALLISGLGLLHERELMKDVPVKPWGIGSAVRRGLVYPLAAFVGLQRAREMLGVSEHAALMEKLGRDGVVRFDVSDTRGVTELQRKVAEALRDARGPQVSGA